MKRIVILILLGITPLLGAWFNMNSICCMAQPTTVRWERNVASLPETIKETLAVAFPTYIIVEYKRSNNRYTILLKSAEEAIYVSLNAKGEVLNETGAYIFRT